MQKVIAIFIVGLLSTSCGSLSTLPRSEQAIRNSLVKSNSRCSYIPYVYSGLVYDSCYLNAGYERTPEYPENITYSDADARSLGAFLAVDFVLSGVVDTFALSYTWYMQNRYGSIALD